MTHVEGAIAGTAVIYARFSCSKQREASIEDQLRVCREWCGREGYAIVAEYCDHAVSGRTDDRPQFQQMIANAGESDIVLVYMMDRFSRDPFDAPIYKRELARKGVRLVSALENIPDSPEGIIYEKLLEGLAACESRKTAIRTRRGMEGNALKCKTNGVRVYGYRRNDDDLYEVVPEQAEVVREAFSRRLQGEAIHGIARDFASRGVKTCTGRPCNYTMVYNMLHNQKYRGVYSWGGITQEGGMPRIVDDELFLAVQGVRGKKVRANESWGDFVLSGRVICAACGRNMPGVSGRGHQGVKYEYHACRDCKEVKPVRRDWLEGAIVAALRDALADREEAVRVSKLVLGGQDDVERERRSARRSLDEAERGLRNILKSVEEGLVVPGTKERVAQLEEQRDRAERDLAMLEGKKIDPELFADFLQFGSTLDDATLLDAFVYQVMVSNEDVTVTLNYDAKENEPARLAFSRVRTELDWWPHQDSNLEPVDYESIALTVAPWGLFREKGLYPNPPDNP